ncbi:MAG: bifunctional nuclease domain-containing protein [Saprospiraceae bacterium]
MKKIELDIVALSHSVTQSHNYAVVLGEQDGSRRLPIVIGGFEAQAIAVAMERMTPNRPLTHDLFKNTLETFEVELKEVIINNLLDGIFYARLICLKDGEEFEIDSRTSDALAMAVRFNCPIFTYEFILDAAGVILEDTEEEGLDEKSSPSKKPKAASKKGKRKRTVTGNTLSSYTSDELSKMLEEVLADEDYERAAKIRDEITRREGRES